MSVYGIAAAKVVAMGFFQGEGRGLYLGEEFHHNRINIVRSQISGVSPDLKYRWDSLRLAQMFMGLVADGRLNLRPQAAVQAVIDFGAESAARARPRSRTRSSLSCVVAALR